MTDVAPGEHAKDQPIIVYPSAWKLLGLALVWSGMAALTIWAAIGGLITVVPFLLLFVCAAVYAFYRVIRRSPALIIDHAGIYHDVVGLRPQRLAWAEIQSVGRCLVPAPYGLFSFRYLAVVPRDPDAFLAQQTGVLRWLLRWYMETSPAPIMIPQHTLPVSIGWIMLQLRAQYSPPLQKRQIWDDEELEQKRHQLRHRGQRQP